MQPPNVEYGAPSVADENGFGPPRLGVTDLQPLEGGVSGSAVWRARLGDRTVVVKRTERLELLALELVSGFDEPVISTVIESGVDEHGPWLILPYHRGELAGLTAELPPDVHRCMGRIHARFAGAAERLPGEFERLQESFVDRVLTEFGPNHLAKARDLITPAMFQQASALLTDIAADREFRAAGHRFASTLLHGDLQGMNVLLPGDDEQGPMIIDWNTTRVGPPMFDVAMTSDYDSDARRAHDEGWAEVAGTVPDLRENRASHTWASALINIGFAPIVALRGAPAAAEDMISRATEAAARFRH